MAWVKVRPRKGRAQSYRVFWRDPDQRIRSRTFRNSREAHAFARSVEVRKAEGHYIDPAAGRITFAEMFEHYLDTAGELKPSSRSLYRKQADLHLLPTFGTRALSGIAPGEIRAFLADLGKRTGASTVASVYRLLRRVLNVAVDEERIARNPAARIRVPREAVREPRFLTAEEVRSLADEVPQRFRALVLLLAFGGLRIGEAGALRVKDLDLLRRRVVVRGALVEVDGVLVEGTPKGGRVRTVTLPAFLADVLGQHVEAFTDGRASSRVFTGDRGADLRQSFFRRKVFHPACRRIGLDPAPRVHDLRHTAVALAIRAGYHAKAIQEMVGHASITTTLDQYGHLFETLQEEGADRLDAIYAAASGGEVVALPGREVVT